MDVTTDTQPISSEIVAAESGSVESGTKKTLRRKWHKTFIRAYRKDGNMTRACALAGVTRSTIFRVRKQSERFDKAFRKAHIEARHRKVDTMEQALYHRAIHGTKEPLVSNGKIIGAKRKHHDVLLLRGLEAESPKWTRKSEVRTHSTSQVLVSVETRNALLYGSQEVVDAACTLAALLAKPTTSLALPCLVDSTEGETTA